MYADAHNVKYGAMRRTSFYIESEMRKVGSHIDKIVFHRNTANNQGGIR